MPHGQGEDATRPVTDEIGKLKARLKELEEENHRLRSITSPSVNTADQHLNSTPNALTAPQIERYSRQMLVKHGFGVQGQLKLLNSSVLVVGAGGIGSAVLLYLAGAGVGRIAVVDFDVVEVTNLHRQVIHSTSRLGVNKALSAVQSLVELNPSIEFEHTPTTLSHDNALDLVSEYDVVVDASDNPRTRYLINDACVLAGKPLVSASAVGTEAQLTVYNWEGGPCYRCLYPKVAVSAACTTCSDAGVLGPVPGLVGILQAMEVIKIVTSVGDTLHDRLIMYDALKCSFLSVKKRPKRTNCAICGHNPTIQSMQDSREDLINSRGPSTDTTACAGVCSLEHTLPIHAQLSCEQYNERFVKPATPHVLIDVRVAIEFEMCHLDGAVSIPLADLRNNLDRIEKLSGGKRPVLCICRRGVASVEATDMLLKATTDYPGIYAVQNISGGLTQWHRAVDLKFPKY